MESTGSCGTTSHDITVITQPHGTELGVRTQSCPSEGKYCCQIHHAHLSDCKAYGFLSALGYLIHTVESTMLSS